MNICICLAHNYPALDINFALSVFQMQAYFNEWVKSNNRDDKLFIQMHGGYNLDKMRDNVTVKAINAGADLLLYLDTDMIFPAETVAKLMMDLENNPEYDAVSGLYVGKKSPYLPQIFSSFDKRKRQFLRPVAFWLDTLFPIEGCGAGIMMVRAEAIKKLELPYFKFIYKGEHEYLKHGMGEDLYFCWKLNNAKCKILCDPMISCGHYDTRSVDLGSYIRYNNFEIKDNQIQVTKKQVEKIEKEVKSKYKKDRFVKHIRAK